MPSSNVNVDVDALLAKEDITDPTDFPPPAIVPGLRQIDSALRCKICKELISAPVTLQCGHCFCSLCIRSTLVDKQECPSCRKAANEGHLRTNPLVEEIVTSWMEARALVLRLAKEEERRVTHPSSTEPTTPSPRNSRVSGKKRKLSEESSPSSLLDTPGPSRIKQRRSSKDPTTPKPRKRPFKESDPFDDFDLVATSDSREDELPSVADDNIVDCPICRRPVRYKMINDHIDANCPPPDGETPHDRRSKKAEWSNIFGVTPNDKRKGNERPVSPIGPDPLPKAAYNVLKLNQLRNMLAEHKLPVGGDRNALIARHQRWIMIYNGNLDRSVKQRKAVEDLRQELRRWEQEKKSKKSTVNDSAAYQKAHRTEFARLVEAARPKKDPEERDGKDERQAVSADDTEDEEMVMVDSEEERVLSSVR